MVTYLVPEYEVGTRRAISFIFKSSDLSARTRSTLYHEDRATVIYTVECLSWTANLLADISFLIYVYLYILNKSDDK